MPAKLKRSGATGQAIERMEPLVLSQGVLK